MIEGTEKIEGQTNKHEQSLGLTKSRGRYATLCIPDSIYGLTLAWVTSENSTMLLESDSSWLTLAGPYPMLPRLSAPVSVVDCTCPWFHANPLLLASLCPAANCSRPGCVVNSLSRPLPTSGYGEISGPRILCLVSRQNRQRNHLLWQPTHIVLHTTLSYPCHLILINYNTIQQQAKKTKTFTVSNNRTYKILKGFVRPLEKK